MCIITYLESNKNFQLVILIHVKILTIKNLSYETQITLPDCAIVLCTV